MESAVSAIVALWGWLLALFTTQIWVPLLPFSVM